MKSEPYNKEDHKIHARIHKLLPTDDEKCDMIATLLGCSGVLCESFMKNNQIKKMDYKMRYVCALIAGNLLAFMSGATHCDKLRYATKPFDSVGEQGEEEIYRRFKNVVIQLYETIKDETDL